MRDVRQAELIFEPSFLNRKAQQSANWRIAAL